jgi:hypothetical protein
MAALRQYIAVATTGISHYGDAYQLILPGDRGATPEHSQCSSLVISRPSMVKQVLVRIPFADIIYSNAVMARPLLISLLVTCKEGEA